MSISRSWQAYWSECLPAGRPRGPAIGIAVAVGLLCGLLNTVYAISYVGLAFPGPLAPHLGSAIGLALLATSLASVVVASTFRYPGSMAVVSPEATLVIGGVGLHLVDRVAPSQLLPTMLAILALVTIAMAGVLWGTGRARLGRLMHYLPYPVVAGMIGGLGVLLVLGGLELAAPGLGNRVWPSSREGWLEVALTAAFGLLLWLWQGWRSSALAVPIACGICILIFALVAVGGAPVEPWLLDLARSGIATGHDLAWSQLALVDWPAIAGVLPTLLMLVAFMAMIVLTDAASLELALRVHLEPNQTLQTFGGANAAAALAGIPIGMSISGSILACRSGVPCRLVGMIAAATTLGVWYSGPRPFAYIPAFVVGGLIVYVGLQFLREWVFQQWRGLNGADRAVLTAVVMGVSMVGFAEGFALGLLLAVLFFVVSCSRQPVLRHETTARYRFSHAERSAAELNRLRAEGDRVCILELGGFLFFGSAARVHDLVRVRALRASEQPLRAVILDFRRVSGVDSSGWHNFHKIADLATQHGFVLVLCHLSAALQRAVQAGGTSWACRPALRFAADLDHALEALETATLASPRYGLAESPAESQPDPLDQFDSGRLQRYADQCSFAPGDTLIRQGDGSDDIFIVRSGTLSVLVDGPAGDRVRLRTAGPGTLVGEIAFILAQPRTAWVVAETAVTADRITRAGLARMATEQPQLLVDLQTAMLRILARRVSDSTELVVQLSR